ncbi:methyltransferase [Dacryopinax primogenitus]|uniref:tRNA N(3)-methylcytidine methyltransferase n=1 Tax=Dacryopinax primogenitus (strain DJM 731) TaxID=1858805 RepID=M5G4T3_DACPD|nr:methyltransferase [Dacryopinax primogenitus]EJU03679.1 methyltransferase [Dacryopinax primogenitus]
MDEATPGESKRTASTQTSGAPPPFGSRFLTPSRSVWEQNAWDHVPPPDDQGERIALSLERQRASRVSDADRNRYNARPEKYWDAFYRLNQGNFFKDRKWLHLEFPELFQATREDAGEVTVWEPGCGVGNALFPLVQENENDQLKLVGCDYSKKAIEVVHANPLYHPPKGSLHAQVWDLASPLGLPESIPPGSVDIVLLIFVLSALHPDEWTRALANIWTALKPSGLVLIRDYGRHDLTQLRFRTNRLMEENLYVRGDGTRVYFFELGELGGLAQTQSPLPPAYPLPPHPLFSAQQLGIDRRLLVNRKRQLKMYRVWVQAKFCKL